MVSQTTDSRGVNCFTDNSVSNFHNFCVVDLVTLVILFHVVCGGKCGYRSHVLSS